MDAKDLRTEAVLGERSNDGNSKYSQASVLQANRNKTYHDVGSNTMAKVEGQGARPCAVIGPDRVVPPAPAPPPADAYLKKASVEPWPTHETLYRKPPEYPHILPDYNHPSRNISPRQTFQENMQRFMLPPSYNSTKLMEDHNHPVDANSSPLRNKISGSAEGKYCEVPYVVSPLASEQKNVRSADVGVSNSNPTLPKSAPHGWLPSSANIRPGKPYGAPEVYQYPEYQNCSGPRPVLVPRPHRTVHEDPGHMYPESYYHDANLRYKPYPTIKERNPQARYDYVGNYSNPFHPPPPPFPSHKYEIQKQLHPHPYAGYPQVPLKYMDRRMADPSINSFQRPINPNTNLNSVAYRNQMIHPQYGPVPGNCLQSNKFYPYPPDKSISANKPPYDATAHKAFGEYENMRAKPYHMSDTYYVNEMMRGHPVKPTQVMPPSYPTVGMPGMPPHHYYYRKDNPTMMNYENNPHYRNIDPSINLNGAMLSRLPTHFSPNAIAISPSESNTINDITSSLGTLQEDCGYVSQSSLGSIRSVDSGLNRMQGDFYKRYDYRYGPMAKFPPPSKSNISSNTNIESKNKKNINLKQYLEMWNEGEDENGESTHKEMTISTGSNQRESINHHVNSNHEPLYVLGLVNVPSEELSKYEHIQKVSKLPENIKGYNSIELLNQFEEVIESSNLNDYSGKPPTPRNFQMSSLQGSTMESIRIPSRPLSPLDVEAKISQSVIHKEVGCNFEIRPCSPKMLSVEVATPIKNVLSERVIEKVNNPVSSPTTSLTKIDDNVRDCEVIKHHNHRLSLNDNKTSSCKMTSSQYTSSEHSNSVKSNYSLQDLESNSGVCLASLPRLDNDIELTFPEVNQQFINANKFESVITTTQKDLPSLDVDQSEVIHEIEMQKSLPQAEPEKEFSKLSKYRKRRRNSDCKEDMDTNVQSTRTNSVIMINPENTKIVERCTDNFSTMNMQDAQRDPINLSVYSEVRQNAQKSDYIESTRNTCQNLKPIAFCENSSTGNDIENKGSFIDKNRELRRDERCDEEIISMKSIVVPNDLKSKNDVSCTLESSDIKEDKLECNVNISEDFAPVAKLKKIDRLNYEENMVKVGQSILKETSESQQSILTDDIKEVQKARYIQSSECGMNINNDKVSLKTGTINTKHNTSTETEDANELSSVNNTSLIDDKTFEGIQEGSKEASESQKSVLTGGIMEVEKASYIQSPECDIIIKNDKVSLETDTIHTKHNTSTEKKDGNELLSVNNTSLIDDKTFEGFRKGSTLLEGDNLNLCDKLRQECENLSKPDFSSNLARFEIQSDTEELCDTVPHKSFEPDLGLKPIEYSAKKLQKELYSPRIQNLIVCLEGNPDKKLLEADSDFKKDNAEINISMQTSLEECDVGMSENLRFFDKSRAAENSEGHLGGKSKNEPNSVCCDAMVNIDTDTDLSAQTAHDDVQHPSASLRKDTLKNNIDSDTSEHTKKVQDSFFSNDSNESVSSTSSTTDSDSSDDLSDVTSSIDDEKDLLSPSKLKDLPTDMTATDLQSLEQKDSSRTQCEKFKENCKTTLETCNTFSGILDPSNRKRAIFDVGLSNKKYCHFSVDRDVEISSCTDIEFKDKCDAKINFSDEDKFKENSTLIEGDYCGSVDHSENKDTQECKKDILSEFTLLQADDCDSMDHSKSKDIQESKKDILSDEESKLIQADYCDSIDHSKSKDIQGCKKEIQSDKESDHSISKEIEECQNDILSDKDCSLIQADNCDPMEHSKGNDTLACKRYILSDKDSTLIQADDHDCDSMDHSKSKDTLKCKMDILSDKDSTLIQTDDHDSGDLSKNKDIRKCEKNILSDKDSILIQTNDQDSGDLSKNKNIRKCEKNILSDKDSILIQTNDHDSGDLSKNKDIRKCEKNILSDKDSTLIQTDDHDSGDISKNKDIRKCEKNILSDKDSTLIQTDDHDSGDISKNKDIRKCEKNILSDKDSILIQTNDHDSGDLSKNKDIRKCEKNILSDKDSTLIQTDDHDSGDISKNKDIRKCEKNILSDKDSTFIESDDRDLVELSKNKDTHECEKNIVSDKDSTFIQSYDCDSIDHSKCKDTQESKKEIMGDNNDLLQIPCEYSSNSDKIDEPKLKHYSEKSNLLVEENVVIVETKQSKENLIQDFVHTKIDTEDCQKLIEETINEDFIHSQNNDDAQVDNFHYRPNSEDICNDSDNFLSPEVEENSNKSFHRDNQLCKDIHQNSKSAEETIEMIRNFNDLAGKINYFNTNYSHNRPKPLKRSLSDSAINACNISQDDEDNCIFSNKRKKTTQPVTLQSQYITENFCNIIQNNRRNSVTSVYNEDNVSFCILIDNSCILTEECEGSDKFCYTEIPEQCLSCIESDEENEIIEESTELISIQDEISYDHCDNISLNKDAEYVGERESHDPWVDDIACVETVVSEELSEDIVVNDCTSPRDRDMSDEDSDLLHRNEHTDKVKYIYGEGMCTDDAYIVETLYRTPQMNVNKTLVRRESQDTDDCHRYYDTESLEKLLSESPTLQNETSCPLDATTPSPNTDTDSIEKSDFKQGSHSDTRLTEVECIIEQNSANMQDDTVHSCETSVDDVFTYGHVKESPKRTASSPEVSSTTSEERNSSIRLKITTFGGSRVAEVNSSNGNKRITSVSCKYTEKKDYAESQNNLLPNRPLITKAAQKYIPPIKETIRDLKVKLPLSQQSLLKLKELKMSKEEPKVTNNKINKHNNSNCIRKEIPKKTKPKFEDVLKSIDELQFKMHKEKSKKNNKKHIPKVVIKKNENGSHYTSISNKERYNPDLTGRKWQPWVFIEKNHFIDKMAIENKTKAVFSHRKNTFILAETFKKYKSCNAKFIISQPVFSESSKGHLKYTIRLKHNY